MVEIRDIAAGEERTYHYEYGIDNEPAGLQPSRAIAIHSFVAKFPLIIPQR